MTDFVPSSSSAPVETKGSVMRSIAVTLSEHGLLDGVAAAVSPSVRAMLPDPPLATAWIDGRAVNEVFEAIFQLHGVDVLKRMNRQSIERGVSPLIRGGAEGILRIFGVSPATLLSKLGRVAGTISRGVEYRYDATTDTSGTFEIEYTHLVDVPLSVSLAAVGGLDLIFEMCSTRGTFGAPEIMPNGRRNGVRFPVSWRSMRQR